MWEWNHQWRLAYETAHLQLVVAVVAVVEFESSAGGDSFKCQLRLSYKDLVISRYLRRAYV